MKNEILKAASHIPNGYNKKGVFRMSITAADKGLFQEDHRPHGYSPQLLR